MQTFQCYFYHVMAKHTNKNMCHSGTNLCIKNYIKYKQYKITALARTCSLFTYVIGELLVIILIIMLVTILIIMLVIIFVAVNVLHY